MFYFDRKGEPITRDEFGRLHENLEYVRVGSTDLGPYWISTVWLGINHQFGEGPPILFETMVFAKSQRDDPEDRALHDMDCVRYATEDEARAGHEEMVTLVRATLAEIPENTEETT